MLFALDKQDNKRELIKLNHLRRKIHKTACPEHENEANERRQSGGEKSLSKFEELFGDW